MLFRHLGGIVNISKTQVRLELYNTSGEAVGPEPSLRFMEGMLKLCCMVKKIAGKTPFMTVIIFIAFLLTNIA